MDYCMILEIIIAILVLFIIAILLIGVNVYYGTIGMIAIFRGLIVITEYYFIKQNTIN